MKRLTLEEKFELVKHKLTIKHWRYSFTPHQWFRPDDVSPHNISFKRICSQLFEAGYLERNPPKGDELYIGRWGYSYRVPD